MPRKEGEPAWPRLMSTHSFWLALEEVAHFWDDSRDEYYEVPDVDTDHEQHGDGDSGHGQGKESTSHDGKCVCPPETPSAPPRMKKVYRGRRSGNGSSMPEEKLDKAVKGFLDICTRPYRLQAIRRRLFNPSRLAVRDLRLPVSHAYEIGLVPMDPKLARKGHIEGPVLAVHVRSEVGMRAEQGREARGVGNWISRGEVLDLAREAGGCLLLAQKRSGEGRVEVRAGKGKWWGEKRRWGGTRGGHMPYESDEEPGVDPNKKTQEPEEMLDGVNGKHEEKEDVIDVGFGSEVAMKEEEQVPTPATNDARNGNPRKRPGSPKNGANLLENVASGRTAKHGAYVRPRKDFTSPIMVAGNGAKDRTVNLQNANNHHQPTSSSPPGGLSAAQQPPPPPPPPTSKTSNTTPTQHRLTDSNTAAIEPDTAAVEPAQNPADGAGGASEGAGTKKKKRHTARYLAMMEDYRALKPGAPQWDERVRYRRIGRPGSSKTPDAVGGAGGEKADDDDDVGGGGGGGGVRGWDTVFVVSAVNCHFCVVRMRVHEAYLRWLESGEGVVLPPDHEGEWSRRRRKGGREGGVEERGMEVDRHYDYDHDLGHEGRRSSSRGGGEGEGEEEEEEEREEGNDAGEDDVPCALLDKRNLYVDRTRWFNLLDEEDRVEALRGMWAVLGWVMRDVPESVGAKKGRC